MYYTGNLKGNLKPPSRFPSSIGMDASIGLAASEDGLNWQKAPSFSQPDVIANEINPIMAEKLPISIDPDKPQGSVNVFNTLFIVNEASPTVLEIVPDQFFLMVWHQTDWSNLYPLLDSPFPGGSGLGFAFTGNVPDSFR